MRLDHESVLLHLALSLPIPILALSWYQSTAAFLIEMGFLDEIKYQEDTGQIYYEPIRSENGYVESPS